MHTLAVEKSDLNSCVKKAQCERVLLTRNGNPVALVVGIDGLDEEQVQLGSSRRFWKLMRDRRRQKTLSRIALEEKIKRKNKRP